MKRSIRKNSNAKPIENGPKEKAVAGFSAQTTYPNSPERDLKTFAPPVQMFRPPTAISASIDNTKKDDEAGAGKMEGFGATVGAGAGMRTWMTKVSWGGLEAEAGEGTLMDAQPLGPDHPSGQSSPHSDDQSKARAQFLSHLTGQPYIQGHLLNDNLGGPAERRNLTAIPGKPGNSAHEKLVEKPVKLLMDQGLWLHYKVEVKYVDVTISELHETIQDAQISELNGYDNLPGTKPTTCNSQLRIASAFNCEWYTYQADGSRSSAVKRVNILFPHKQYGNANRNTNDYGNAANGYDARFVKFPDVDGDDSMNYNADAVANEAAHLFLEKNLPNTEDSHMPNYPPARLIAIAEQQWQDEIENSVDDISGKIKYPVVTPGHVAWNEADLNRSRIRESRYMSYLKELDLLKNWNKYKKFLIAMTQRKARDEYAAIIAPDDQTPALG